MALLITLFLGVFFLLGALIIKLPGRTKVYEQFSVAAAFGALICIAAFDLMPEIYKELSGIEYIFAFLLILAGFGILKLLDNFIPDHESNKNGSQLVHIGMMSVVAISIHNIIEGMTVYSISLESINSGLSLALGVGLHNIPMGMLIYSAFKREERTKQIIVYAAAVLSTFFGGLIMFSIKALITEKVVDYLVCAALGMVLYIIFCELLPVIQKSKKGKRLYTGIITGALFVIAAVILEEII